jgi:uncharacterized protein (DUF433 family)
VTTRTSDSREGPRRSGRTDTAMPLSELSRHDVRAFVPLYTLAEAASYLDVPSSTLYTWARPTDAPPLITALPKRGHFATLPFIGFAEAFVIKTAIDAGVPNHRIRPGIEKIKARAGGLEHALASRIVYTDGAELLLEAVEEDDDLDVPRTDQRTFREAVENSLKLITFGDDYAERIRLPKYKNAKVVVDPHVASGKPLLESGFGARVKDLVDRVSAGDDPASVARDFKVPLPQLKAILGST